MAFTDTLRRHKKLLTYAGAGIAGYFLLWPHLADFITQKQGSIATPPGAPDPQFVPVYLGSGGPASQPAPTPTLTLPNGTTVPANPATPPSSFQYGPSTYVPVTGANGTGFVGANPDPASAAKAAASGNPIVSIFTPPPTSATPTAPTTLTLPNGQTVTAHPAGSTPSLGGLTVTHSVAVEWDPHDPAQQWNPSSPILPPGTSKVLPRAWLGHLVGSPM